LLKDFGFHASQEIDHADASRAQTHEGSVGPW
jgi:hypothetical protein